MQNVKNKVLISHNIQFYSDTSQTIDASGRGNEVSALFKDLWKQVSSETSPNSSPDLFLDLAIFLVLWLVIISRRFSIWRCTFLIIPNNFKQSFLPNNFFIFEDHMHCHNMATCMHTASHPSQLIESWKSLESNSKVWHTYYAPFNPVTKAL